MAGAIPMKAVLLGFVGAELNETKTPCSGYVSKVGGSPDWPGEGGQPPLCGSCKCRQVNTMMSYICLINFFFVLFFLVVRFFIFNGIYKSHIFRIQGYKYVLNEI